MIYEPNALNLARAAEVIRTRGIVAFPTETVYGLGGDAFAEKALRRIFQIKGRPESNPLIVHLAQPSEIDRVARFETAAQRAWFEKLLPLWPGPLSVVLPKQESVPTLATAGKQSVAVRFPANPIAQTLLKMSGCAIAAPSANPSTYVSPTTAQHVEDQLGELVDMILDGGSCEVGIESTVLSLIHDIPTILRHGAVTEEKLTAILGEVASPSASHSVASSLSPGTMPEHYAPKTALLFREEFDPSATSGPAAYVTFSTAPPPDWAAVTKTLSDSGDLDEAAARLFATLRELDSGAFRCIVVERCSEKGIGRALMDRLSRARAKHH